jgi:hypothetical protein
MEQPKEGPVHYHISVPIIYKKSYKFKRNSGREVPRCDSPVPQSAKTGASERWTGPTQAQNLQKAAELTGNYANQELTSADHLLLKRR